MYTLTVFINLNQFVIQDKETNWSKHASLAFLDLLTRSRQTGTTSLSKIIFHTASGEQSKIIFHTVSGELSKVIFHTASGELSKIIFHTASGDDEVELHVLGCR